MRSQPYLGQVGTLSMEQELKAEVTGRRAKVQETLAAIQAVHPHEELVINVIPCIRLEYKKCRPKAAQKEGETMTGRYMAFDVETPNCANDRIRAIGVTAAEEGAA